MPSSSVAALSLPLAVLGLGMASAFAQKVALAVRSYLIDQSVKARIEIGAFAASSNGVGGDRVDVLAP